MQAAFCDATNRVKFKMQKVFVIAAILMIAAPGNAREIKTSPIDRAINAWIHANSIVQNAIDHDVCWGRDATREARNKLSRENAAEYDAIIIRLQHAYAATNGTDTEHEAVREAFCYAIE